MVEQTLAPPMIRGKRYPMSWEEFLDWAPDEGKAEWVAGEGIAYVSNSLPHGRMVKLLSALLDAQVEAYDLGEVFSHNELLRLESRPSGRMPDIFVMERDALDQSGSAWPTWIAGPALLAVEFISDDSVERDLVEKRAEYERAGIPEYLAIDAREQGDEWLYLRLDADGRYQPVTPDEEGRYHSRVLPGFWFDPAWFRQEPLPNPWALLRRLFPAVWRRLTAEIDGDG